MQDIKVFNRWPVLDVVVKDEGLKRYICLKTVYLPHSGGRHEHRRFGKADVSIVERLVNKLMRPGRSGGKKALATSIVKNSFEIIHLQTGENPIQVLVRAIENSAPREETTRITYGGIVYHSSVDSAPQRRLDLALTYISEGARAASFNNPRTIEECLAEAIILAAKGEPKCYSIQKKDEVERIALSNR